MSKDERVATGGSEHPETTNDPAVAHKPSPVTRLLSDALTTDSKAPGAMKTVAEQQSVMRLLRQVLSGVIATATLFAGIVTVIAKYVHGNIAPWIVTGIGIVALSIVIVLGITLRQRMKRYGVRVLWETAGWAVALILLGVLAFSGIVGLTTAWTAIRSTAPAGPGRSSTQVPRSQPPRPPTGTGSGYKPTQGSIASPINNMSNIPVASILTAYGTIRNRKPNQHLILFLRLNNSSVYFIGDPKHQVITPTTWSLQIYIDQSVPNGQRFTLYLTDLGPRSWKYVNGTSSAIENKQSHGFQTPTPGPDAFVLNQVTFTSYQPPG